MAELSQKVLKGDRLAVSKAITAIENRDQSSGDILKGIFPQTGRAFIVGVTGPPGTGKSSLVDQLVRLYRAKDKRIAVLAVDPSSHVSGGAILGDRVRMMSHTLDSGVYIRSMASRGDEGGLSRAARNAVRILDAAGNDVVIVETVGTGQTEVEIVRVADVVVVVLMPELGDEIQAAKAGLMEIGDIFAVNKCDLPGSDKVMYNLETVLTTKSGWHQVAVKVSAKTGEGLDNLLSALEEFRAHMQKSSDTSRKIQNISEELLQNVSLALAEEIESSFRNDPELHEIATKVVERQIDPESAVRILVQRFRAYSSRKDSESTKRGG